MKSLLLATHNKAKLHELKLGAESVLKDTVRIVSLDKLGIKLNPHESGKTFEENSLLKARFYGKLSGLPTVGDDGGLVIPALNNEPGVKSRRWLGYEGTDQELIEHTLERLKGLPKQKRVAYLETCLCFYDPKTNVSFCEQEKIRGYIAHRSSGRPTEGYPFRALFVVERFDRYYDELTEKEHHDINHRLIALKRLLNKVKKYLIE